MARVGAPCTGWNGSWPKALSSATGDRGRGGRAGSRSSRTGALSRSRRRPGGCSEEDIDPLVVRRLHEAARFVGRRLVQRPSSPRGSRPSLSPDRRRDARGAATELPTGSMTHGAISPACVRDIRPRGGAVPVRRCCGPARRSLPRERWPCCRGCCRCCAVRSPARGSASGSIRASRHRRSSTSWRPAHGSTTSCRCRRTPRWCGTPNPPLSGREGAVRAAAEPSSSSPRPAMRPVGRGAGRDPRDNPRFVVTDPRPTVAVTLREGLVRARGHREPDQRVARRIADRPHQLLPVRREPVAGSAHGCRLRAPAGASPEGRTHRLCPHPSDVALRSSSASTSSAPSVASYRTYRAPCPSTRGPASHSPSEHAPDRTHPRNPPHPSPPLPPRRLGRGQRSARVVVDAVVVAGEAL